MSTTHTPNQQTPSSADLAARRHPSTPSPISSWRASFWRGLLAFATLTVTCCCALGTTSAQAGQMTVFSCHDPAGNAVGHDGWIIQRTNDSFMTTADNCAAAGQGSMVADLGANPAGYPNFARTEWVFFAPSWASIASYTLQLPDSYTINTTAGQGQVFVNASDETDPPYDYRNLGAGSWGTATVSRTPPAPVSQVTVDASCDGYDGPCPAGAHIAHVDLTAATLLLNDSTTPSVSNLAGTLVSGAPLRGTVEASFNAQDGGPGVYSGWLIIDGQPQPATVLNSNNGWCQNLGQTSNGTRSFAHPDPCPQSTSASLTLDTTGLPDGQHTLKIMVDDAAGDTTTAYNATITTNNAPANTLAPTITEPAQLLAGTTLTAQPGTWSAPNGTGTITYGYQWQDCNSEGTSCKTIPDAQNANYTLTSNDAGHTLRVLVTASDNDGLTTAPSTTSTAVPAPRSPVVTPPPSSPAASATSPPPTPAGTPPSTGGPAGGSGAANGTPATETAQVRLTTPYRITRSYTKRAFTITGHLLTATEQPITNASLDILERVATSGQTRLIGHAHTATTGSFTIHVPTGPSRQIQIAYRAFANDNAYTALASISETVNASVQLAITPKQTSSTGTITLSGKVQGPIPRYGALVELLVHYHGRWVPIPTKRTKPNGRFKISYKFQGAIGLFPFWAEIPAGQAGFPYAHGYSNTIEVRAR
jgi:hypothetical protein